MNETKAMARLEAWSRLEQDRQLEFYGSEGGWQVKVTAQDGPPNYRRTYVVESPRPNADEGMRWSIDDAAHVCIMRLTEAGFEVA